MSNKFYYNEQMHKDIYRRYTQGNILERDMGILLNDISLLMAENKELRESLELAVSDYAKYGRCCFTCNHNDCAIYGAVHDPLVKCKIWKWRGADNE